MIKAIIYTGTASINVGMSVESIKHYIENGSIFLETVEYKTNTVGGTKESPICIMINKIEAFKPFTN
jgi:hypothetical protein